MRVARWSFRIGPRVEAGDVRLDGVVGGVLILMYGDQRGTKVVAPRIWARLDAMPVRGRHSSLTLTPQDDP